MAATTDSRISAARRSFQGLAATTLVLTAMGAGATDSYVPSGQQLTIPALRIGSATYSNVIVIVHDIVTPPSGSSPNGSVDTYDPASGLLTVQSVKVGGNTYYNAVVTVASLVSIGSVTGADTFNGTYLNIPSVAVGAAHYSNVTLTASTSNVLGVGQGLPRSTQDQYDAGSGQLTIAAVQVGSRVYTNVVVSASLSDVVAAGPAASIAQVQHDIFTPYCASCHSPGQEYPDLSSASASVASTVNVVSGEAAPVLEVAPGDPNNSFLIQKLTDGPNLVGHQMPKGGPYLSQAQIEEVSSWILSL